MIEKKIEVDGGSYRVCVREERISICSQDDEEFYFDLKIGYTGNQVREIISVTKSLFYQGFDSGERYISERVAEVLNLP